MSRTPAPWRDEAVTTAQAEQMRGPLPQDFLIIGADGLVVGIVYDFADRTAGNARLITAGAAYHDAAHRLAMLALQSDRYAYDPEYKEAVDDVLAIWRSVEVKG